MEDKIHIGKLICNKLKENGRSVSWLARQVYCDRSNLRKMLKNNHIYSELLLRISIALDYDFFAHYSSLICNKENLLR
ncbi:MAG: XRE family transcriptional regulator [Prevotellaceae bacterium]|nr:XRE family transcriptional regulator [Prevotellaceae bacterium]